MLFIKSTNKTVAPHVYAVDVAAKPPGKTYDVFLAVDADNEPAQFLQALESMGFVRAFSSTYTHSDGKKVLDLHYRKAGTDIFEGWKESEREANMKGIQEIFASFGLELKPRVMSLAEAF
jgi:hypothetical protein